MPRGISHARSVNRYGIMYQFLIYFLITFHQKEKKRKKMIPRLGGISTEL